MQKGEGLTNVPGIQLVLNFLFSMQINPKLAAKN